MSDFSVVQHYDSNEARKYDRLRWWRPPVPRRIVKISGMRPYHRVLDMACGTGNLIIALQKICPAIYTGIDMAGGMLGRAKEKLPDSTFVRGDLVKMPFADASFDCLEGSFFIHHIPLASLPDFFAEAWRVLDSGWFSMVTRSHEQVRDCILGRFFPEVLEIDLARFPAIEWLEALMKSKGFRETGAESIIDRHIRLDAEYVEWMRSKPISTLDMITPAAFEAGIERIERYIRDEKPGDKNMATPFTLVFGRKM